MDLHEATRRGPGLRQRRLDRGQADRARRARRSSPSPTRSAGIRNLDGLDIDRVIAWKKEHGTVQGFPGAEDITNAEVLETDCDILIPAALENQITGAQRRTGSRRRSSPRPPTARRRRRPTRSSHDRGVFMIPDILCNAGGVTVSYFEWVQDLNRDHWTEDEVNEKLKEIMVKAFHEVLDAGRRRKASTCAPART